MFKYSKVKNYKSKEFLKLQKEWYKKLADSGFDDVEEVAGKGYAQFVCLKRSCRHLRRRFSLPQMHYFAYCRNFLAHGQFATELDRKIFELHTDGVSLRQIVKQLRQIPALNFDCSVFWVFARLKYLKIEMYKWLQDDREANGEPRSLVGDAEND